MREVLATAKLEHANSVQALFNEKAQHEKAKRQVDERRGYASSSAPEMEGQGSELTKLQDQLDEVITLAPTPPLSTAHRLTLLRSGPGENAAA